MTEEYINRRSLIRSLRIFAPEHYTPLVDLLIEKEPAADVVEVVRCKDCHYYEEVEYYPNGTKNICRLIKREMYPNSFCCCGERKEK